MLELIAREDNPEIAWSEVKNDLRVDAVEDHSQDSLDDLKNRVAAANDEAVAAVARIDPVNLARPGHREANPITVARPASTNPTRPSGASNRCHLSTRIA